MPKDYQPYFLFLDNLRKKGLVNMWGSVGYLLQAFSGLNKAEATQIFSLWAHDSKRHTKQ